MNNRADGIRSSAFPTLVDDQIEFLRRYGEVRKIEPGQVLFREGDRSYDFIVILDGEVEIVDDFEGEVRTIAVHGARRFLGELNMLTGQAVYLTAAVLTEGEVLAIPPENLKKIIAEEPTLSDIILKAFLIGELIKEEHELYHRAEKGGLGAHEHERLGQLEVNLDRCWTPRGHRRMLTEAGYDPDGATVRSEKIDRRGLLAMTPQSGHEALGRSLA